jgi:integration host factor subunit alpha
MALTKADIAEHLNQVLDLNKSEARNIVDNFFEVIREALACGKPVKLSGFGNFVVRNKKERPGRNPRTGELIPVSARRVVTFKAGQKLKTKIEKIAKPSEIA